MLAIVSVIGQIVLCAATVLILLYAAGLLLGAFFPLDSALLTF
jgi:hypothetical protein